MGLEISSALCIPQMGISTSLRVNGMRRSQWPEEIEAPFGCAGFPISLVLDYILQLANANLVDPHWRDPSPIRGTDEPPLRTNPVHSRMGQDPLARSDRVP